MGGNLSPQGVRRLGANPPDAVRGTREAPRCCRCRQRQSVMAATPVSHWIVGPLRPDAKARGNHSHRSREWAPGMLSS